MRELTGRHVAGMFGLGFGTIIAVNAALAYSAVRSFPGLEVQNSYVASQAFEEARTQQEALGWDVSATLADGLLTLRFEKDGRPVEPRIISAVFGRATSVTEDLSPAFEFKAGAFTAPVSVDTGNWNLRVLAEAADATRFQQRIVVETVR